MNDEEQFKQFEAQMANMDFDGMIKQMMGALDPGAAGEGSQADMANNPFFQMMNAMGEAPNMGGQGNPMGGEGQIDDQKLQEASKLFEDCLTQIKKETEEYQQNQASESVPQNNTPVDQIPSNNSATDDPILAGNKGNASGGAQGT